MDLMISEPASRLAPAGTLAEATDILTYMTGPCALGQALVARSTKGVCAILIGDGHGELEADLAARFPRAKLVVNDAVVRDDLAKVSRFVDDSAEGLHLKLDLRGTPFQRRVCRSFARFVSDAR